MLMIVAIVLATVNSAPPPSGPALDITSLNVRSPDNACGLNGDNSGTVTLSPPGGSIPFISWGLPGPSGVLPCTVSTVSTNTSGFELFGGVPYTATSFPSVLTVSMIAPASFHGVLNVTFT